MNKHNFEWMILLNGLDMDEWANVTGIVQNCNRFFGTDTPSARDSNLRFRFKLGLNSSRSSLLLPTFVFGIGKRWPTVGAGLFRKYSIFSASVAVHRLCGYIASNFSINISRSLLAAVKMWFNGVPGKTLNWM